MLAARGETFPVIQTHVYRVATWCRLERPEIAELLLDSYDIRGGRRRRDDVGLRDLLA